MRGYSCGSPTRVTGWLSTARFSIRLPGSDCKPSLCHSPVIGLGQLPARAHPREREGARMMPLDWLLIAFCLAATSLHVSTSALAMHRCRQSKALLPPPEGAPAVSILRPVRGVD